ncbi:endonuclease/exonuclease/phosphatase family protein [Niabella ginsengisoli]|uniref:Endonuclease/exonuclease/phosphatase domain-containing protein n=1 Tax=Niabella ginsengisoli TaxID=522298 RepID=A0ABS9SJ98_9BACT|nr:hypothetical protein [Niabella ginsengisoli]MCH5598386.1 hypothetical protein [Niabella ginsengisoli]
MFSKMINLFYLVLVVCSYQKKLVEPELLPINAAATARSYQTQDLSEGRLKVMTWNIAKGVGNANGAPDDEPSDYNLDNTIYIIRHSGADIVGLGEVAFEWDALTQFHNQPACSGMG